jgi:hypothetical protein
MTKIFQQLGDQSISVTTIFPQIEGIKGANMNWGQAHLRKIFNFASREVVTLYERGGLSNENYQNAAGAMTSSMDIRNFENIEGKDEIKEAYDELKKRKGKLAELEEYLTPPTSLRKFLK